MSIYILILLVLNIAFIFGDKNRYKNVFLLYILFLLFLFASLRYGVGPDYIAYKNIFLNIETMGFKDQYLTKGVEIGYIYMIFLIKTICNNFQFQIVLMNVFIFIFFYKGIRYSKDKYRSIFILYTTIFLYSIFSTYRQGLSMMIFLYNLQNIYNKKMIKYLFFAILGGMFHTTSLLTIPLYFIVDKKYKKYIYIIILIFSIIISRPEIIKIIISNIVIFFNNPLTRKLNYYYFIKNNNSLSRISMLAWMSRVFQICWLIFFLYISNWNLNRKERIIFNTFYLGIITFILLSTIGVLAGRISDIFEVSLILFIPMILEKLRTRKTLKIIMMIHFLLYFNLFFIKELNSNHGGHITKDYLPYKSIIQKEN